MVSGVPYQPIAKLKLAISQCNSTPATTLGTYRLRNLSMHPKRPTPAHTQPNTSTHPPQAQTAIFFHIFQHHAWQQTSPHTKPLGSHYSSGTYQPSSVPETKPYISLYFKLWIR